MGGDGKCTITFTRSWWGLNPSLPELGREEGAGVCGGGGGSNKVGITVH